MNPGVASFCFTLRLRARPVQAGNRIGMVKGKAIIFSSPKKRAYVQAVCAEARQFRAGPPLTGPVRLDLLFILPRPGRLMRRDVPDGLLPHPVRPDRDNLVKGTQDGLTAAGFWLDDSQICDGRTTKAYAEKDGDARIIVTITLVTQAAFAPGMGEPGTYTLVNQSKFNAVNESQ